MALPLIIMLLLIYGYTLLILLFYLEIEQDADLSWDHENPLYSVSVVVPFKNEEDYLAGLMEDCAGQTFPAHCMEFIFVDDHSEDGSAAMVKSKTGQGVKFRYLALPRGMSGKKKALAHGIKNANFDRIIQVDADCRIGPGFISSHVSFLEKHPSDLVAGMVTTWRDRGNFLEIFDRLDILSLIGAGAGSFNMGRPMMCSGANLSYSRDLYRETRSFDPEDAVASGDDMFLMIGARKLGRTLSFISNRDSMVRTAPQKDLRSMLAQRIRWGSKAGKLKMPDIQMLAVLVVLTNISIFLMPLWILLFSDWWPWLAGAWIVKSLADFMLLFKMTGLLGSRSDMKMFLPVSLLYYPYFILLVLGALIRKPEWKA